jgi:hypothetical protein
LATGAALLTVIALYVRGLAHRLLLSVARRSRRLLTDTQAGRREVGRVLTLEPL